MSPVSYFVLYLITLPDIEASQHAIHRLVFSYKEDCIEMAQQLYQLKDPIVGKPNCVKVDNYEIKVRIPLPKPKELS
jgi:hypothetical protein